MAIHNHLPIYKAALDLTCLSSRLVAHMPRNHRSVDGARLVACSREVLIHIRSANQTAEPVGRVSHIEMILARTDDVESELVVCNELRLISEESFVKAALLTTNVKRQASGWKKSSASKPVSRSSR